MEQLLAWLVLTTCFISWTKSVSCWKKVSSIEILLCGVVFFLFLITVNTF